MMSNPSSRTPRWRILIAAIVVLIVGLSLKIGLRAPASKDTRSTDEPPTSPVKYRPRVPFDSSGYGLVAPQIKWPADASLETIALSWRDCGKRLLFELNERMERERSLGAETADSLVVNLITRVQLLNYEGEASQAYDVLKEARELLSHNPELESQLLYTIIYLQGVTALRRGETENCVLCRGESSCILPIAPAAFHTKTTGSDLAIKHFNEYLDRFPEDLEVKWLLNVAHMTLGHHPHQVDRRHLIPLDRFNQPEFGIGKFRDVGHLVGINRLNQAGGAIMDDFDNDGLLDLVFTSSDPTQAMVFYRNKGDGTFEDRTQVAGLSGQLGGLNCVQTDYNNDGFLDIFIVRGSWLQTPMRPSLLRNNGDGTFTDVTREAGLLAPFNSSAAVWADFDNDGFLDVFICCEKQPNLLYRNKGDGTFEEVAARAGVAKSQYSKGAAWIDYDNDGYPDLFVTNLDGSAILYHNNRDGTFTDVTAEMGIDGPIKGFSCWSWDFDNDGWPDLFATSYDRTMDDVVLGLMGQPHRRHSNKLYRNLQGKKFQDVTREAGLDLVFATMGSNFGDFDNDGYLDIYLATGEPPLSALIPNRMFRNLGGKKFAEITGSSGTGHLQKGHGVACGDWDRDGNIDIAVELGGVTPADRYHNVLFQNPGQGNNWLNVKLTGKRTNRAAIGARIKVVTAGDNPLTVYRYVSSGSSFGGNPLEQHIGLGKAERVARLEIYWPTSGTTQVFKDIAINQGIAITEFDAHYQKRTWKPVPLPK